jgi:hypothetical protein
LNIGQNGAKITDLIDNSNPYSWFPASAALAPDLSFVLCDINDALAGVNVQTYQANLLSYVKQLQISGTVILLASPQIKISDNPEVTQAKYRDAILAVAIATNSIMINFTIQYGSWVNMNAAGMIDDDVHPNGYGYWDMAAVISRILTGVTL